MTLDTQTTISHGIATTKVIEKLPSTLTHILHCNRTGVTIGKLDLTISAGHMPYLSHWREQICYHPFFSVNQYKLCHFLRDEWNRLAKNIADEQITEREALNLRVGFVALLHSLGCIKQDLDCQVLPDLGTVQANLESLVSLSFWQYYLESKRFNFPQLHISNFNKNRTLDSIKDYLSACWDLRNQWDAGIDDQREQEKTRVAERALNAIRDSWMKPVGKKLLWQWVKGNLDKKWQPDAEGWLGTLFLGNTATILDWDEDEIDLMEEIIVSCCPIGNSVMFAVRERIAQIRKVWHDHYDTFTIEEEGLQSIEGFKNELQGTPQPVIGNYKTKAEFFVANAKWTLANPTAVSKPLNVAIASAKSKLNFGADQL